ncbi:MAG: mandelate racemase/muconate lactonizing enzyme family protein [Actinomycetota bacterium]
MKITDVQTTVVGAPWRDLTFVELHTDDGLSGVGEVRMVNKTETLVACVNELAPRYVVGSDPFDVERLAWNIQKAEYGRPGEIAMSALAAFDLACWDLVGQALDVPLWKLLGGCFRERVPAYANGWYQADREPARFAELASGVVERGYRAMKVDPFGAASMELPTEELRRSIGLVEAVRASVGDDVEIFIEMHGRFSPATAIRVAKALEPLEPGWIEEPVGPENASALRRVKEATPLPIATGERNHSLGEFRQLFEEGTVDIVQADLVHFGGFPTMKRLAGWAEAYYLQMAPHNVCGPVATMANVHFAVSTPNYKVLEHFNDFSDPWVFELVDHPPRVDPADGCFGLPTRPGLGLALDHDACAKHPPSGGMIRLFESGWERRADSNTKGGGPR